MDPITVGRLTIKDKTGCTFEIGTCSAADLSCLTEMYRDFSPRPASQGLPPEDAGSCKAWIEELIGIGENVLAWRSEKVIGHAALIPDVKGDSGEFVVFVHQNYRNLGVGTQLTRLILKRARELGFNSVWLTVAITNFIAIKLYVKLGFQYCDMDACERKMMIKL
ncbi:MAG: GNAT family N-acetyltransferase [Desulfobacteraceae bacterium]